MYSFIYLFEAAKTKKQKTCLHEAEIKNIYRKNSRLHERRCKRLKTMEYLCDVAHSFDAEEGEEHLKHAVFKEASACE